MMSRDKAERSKDPRAAEGYERKLTTPRNEAAEVIKALKLRVEELTEERNQLQRELYDIRHMF